MIPNFQLVLIVLLIIPLSCTLSRNLRSKRSSKQQAPQGPITSFLEKGPPLLYKFCRRERR